MLPIALISGHSELLDPFPQVAKFCARKNTSLQSVAWEILEVKALTFICVIDGKFEWLINNDSCILLPNDVLVLKPGDRMHQTTGILEVGTFVEFAISEIEGVLFNRKWSGMGLPDGLLINQLLEQNVPMVIQDFKGGVTILRNLIREITKQEIGYITRVNGLIDEFFIFSARTLGLQNNQSHDFPKIFLKLDKMLRENLAHPWTVSEMGNVVGLGTTAFTEKIKFYTGFAPLHYLINLRVAEAMRMIKNTKYSMTRIALELGFYSSQHFSSTFKKLTGFSPNKYRKNGL